MRVSSAFAVSLYHLGLHPELSRLPRWLRKRFEKVLVRSATFISQKGPKFELGALESFAEAPTHFEGKYADVAIFEPPDRSKLETLCIAVGPIYPLVT